MNLNKIKKNEGFTIVEAIIAVFILSISISAMLGLTASSINSARYANNEISANYLLQEAIDSIRNSRDTIVFQQGGSWLLSFLGGYRNCFYSMSPDGCNISTDSFNPASPTVCKVSDDTACSSVEIGGDVSKFKRQIKMVQKSPDEVEITVEVEYPYGTTTKTRSLKMNLLNWQID